MANENGKPQAQTIPLAKIHDLPGVFISKQPDKAYGGLVTSMAHYCCPGIAQQHQHIPFHRRERGRYDPVAGQRKPIQQYGQSGLLPGRT